MFKLRSPIVYTGKKVEWIEIRCFRCGESDWIHKDNLRVVNYCIRCK